MWSSTAADGWRPASFCFLVTASTLINNTGAISLFTSARPMIKKYAAPGDREQQVTIKSKLARKLLKI